MRLVTWKQGPEEKASLAWVGAIEACRDGSFVTYVSDTEEEARHSGSELATVNPQHLVKLGCDPINKEWAFLLHGSCWEIFTTRFGVSGSTEDTHLATGLARILYCLTRKSAGRLRHGLRPIIERADISLGTEPLRFWTFADIFQANGIMTGKLEQAISEFLTRGSEPRETKLSKRCATTTTRLTKRTTGPRRSRPPYSRRYDIFSRLPRELLLCILPFVRFLDLPNLRLASKCIAAVSTLDQLPASYWKMHFLNDYPYAIPANTDTIPDWRALCFSMPPLSRSRWESSYWNVGSFYRHAKARLRVWKGLSGVRDLICRTPQGFPVDVADWESLTAELDTKWQLCRSEVSYVQPVKPQLEEPYGSSTRIHSWRRLPWVSRDYRLRGIGVTKTSVGGYVFISGIRLVHQVGESKLLMSDELGYTSFASEIVLPVSEHEDLRGIRVVYSDAAITCIKFVFGNMNTRMRRETEWIKGSRSGNDFRLATAHRSCPLLPFTIIGCFDDCGLIGLSMLGAGIVSSQGKTKLARDSLVEH
ncbi:hypothetical protein DL771_006773 [Monosporascus sp. 5C6A]|nr:hypothetical protein DL771_006773 [Monosporascus sp. 5C6A]